MPLVVLSLLLVLALCKSFIGILKVIELVLEPTESTIECIANILKSVNNMLDYLIASYLNSNSIPHLWCEW